MILLDLDTHVTLKLQSTFIYIAQRQHEQVSITHIKQGIAQTTMSKERWTKVDILISLEPYLCEHRTYFHTPVS